MVFIEHPLNMPGSANHVLSDLESSYSYNIRHRRVKMAGKSCILDQLVFNYMFWIFVLSLTITELKMEQYSISFTQTRLYRKVIYAKKSLCLLTWTKFMHACPNVSYSWQFNQQYYLVQWVQKNSNMQIQASSKSLNFSHFHSFITYSTGKQW